MQMAQDNKPVNRSEQLKKQELWRKFKEQFRQEMREKHSKKPTPEKK